MQKFYKNLFYNFWLPGFVCCLSLCSLTTNLRAQGLMFNSNDSLLNKRTSYNVFNYTTPTFDGHLYISFDLSLWDNQNLGYIFSLTGQNDSYSLSYLYFQNEAVLNFNIDRKSTKISKIQLSPSQLGKRKWIKIKVDLDLMGNTASVCVDNKIYKASNIDFEDSMTPKLIFGLNPYYTEVPDMAVKNLVVGDNSKSYSFPLNEWAGNVAHDQSGEEIGLIQNPVWLSNESYFWKPVHNHTFANVAGLNFDPAEDELVMYGRDSLVVYHPDNGNVNAMPYKNPMPIPMVLGKSIFNTKEDKVYAYEAYNETKGAVNMASLDMKTLQWQGIGKNAFPQQRHHHNIFYNASQDSIYLFGGYGSFTYYNAIYNYNPQQDKWLKVKFKGDTITPRFFSAVGKAEGSDDVYLFGGYGNESGSQIVGGKQYYDLYRINLKEHTIKKLWDIHPKEIFVPANNLVLSKDGKYFYAMCYPHEIFKTSIKLYKFSIEDGSYQVVSAAIPVISERIESDINLFFDPKTNQLLCTLQEFTDNHKSTVKVYSLAYPPVANIAYLSSTRYSKASLRGVFIGILVAVFLIAGAGIWVYGAKRKVSPVDDDSPVDEPEIASQLVAVQKTDEPKANSIKLLGEFAAYNRKGKDITYLFSPKIKQLFVLIFLNSREANGIGSKKISQILWPEKDVTKTKNIKGVTFNHLRNIISDIDGIELNFVNDIYIFSLDEQFFCDYCFVSEALKKNDDSVRDLVLENFELIGRGSLLTDMGDSWLDDFKQHYEEQLMLHLIPQLKKLYSEENYKAVLELSRLLHLIDPFNDSVLKYQLKSDRRLKGIDHCKKIYDHYVQEYKKSLGVDYQVSLDKLLS